MDGELSKPAFMRKTVLCGIPPVKPGLFLVFGNPDVDSQTFYDWHQPSGLWELMGCKVPQHRAAH